MAIRIAVAELALGDPAGQDRVRRVQGADVVVGVDPALEVEVVVDHVVRGVGDDEPDDREQRADPSRRVTPSPVEPQRAPTASRPPISPDVAVIEKTAARVMTSHLLIASGVASCPPAGSRC